MHYPCGKLGDCSFSRFSSIVRTHTHTHTQTYADERFTLVSVSNKIPRRVSVTVRESYGFGLGLTGACLDLHS